MNLASVTHDSLSTQLGKEIPEVYVIVAKHRASGTDSESLAEIIGCPVGDLDEIESNELYKEIRQILGAMIARQTADQGILWDSLEEVASRRLLEYTEANRDPEFLLRVAATANRMTRRTAKPNSVLDPRLGGEQVAVKLTRRMVEKITQSHTRVVDERRLSIHDGSMQRPDFKEIDGLLGVRQQITIQEETLSVDALLERMPK